MRRLLLCLLMVATAHSAAPENADWRLYALGDRRGEVQPCGCPRIQLGGLNRLSAFVSQDRAKNAGPSWAVDTGNSFFSLPQLPESRQAEEKRRAELIADSYRLLGVDVLVPGPRDLALGLPELKRLADRAGLKLVATNFVDGNGDLLFAASHIVERNGKKVGFLGVADGSLTPSIGKWIPPLDPLKEAVADLRKAGVLSIVLVAQTETDLESLRPVGADVVVVPPTDGGKGLSVTRWNPQTRKTQWQPFDLDPAWEKPGPVDALMKKYLADLRAVAVDRSTAFTVRPKGAFVAQSGVCRQCHAKQVDFWETTKHASAYLALFAKNQHFNPECIGCHSVGYLEKSGYSDITAPIRLVDEAPRKKGETPFVEVFMKEVFDGDPGKGALDSRAQPERYASLKKRYHAKIREWQDGGKLDSLHMGVQCEHCHGNRSGHPGPTFKKVGKVKKASCLQCHVPPHDESFDFAKRVKQVACPRK